MLNEPADTCSKNRQPWTSELVEQLRELWPNHTAGQIGKMFEMSRNAIIGKARREGLAHKAPHGEERVKGSHSRPRKRAATGEKPVRATAIVERRTITRKAPPLPPIRGGISIMELEAHHCREVVGRGADQQARYCGHPKVENMICIGGQAFRSAYCLGHSLVNYRST